MAPREPPDSIVMLHPDSLIQGVASTASGAFLEVLLLIALAQNLMSSTPNKQRWVSDSDSKDFHES